MFPYPLQFLLIFVKAYSVKRIKFLPAIWPGQILTKYHKNTYKLLAEGFNFRIRKNNFAITNKLFAIKKNSNHSH